MDIGKNFTFITEDEAWIKKVLIGGLSMLLLSLPLFGYIKKMFRNVVEGQEKPLPEWDDFVPYIVDGLKAFAIFLAYLMPVIIITTIPTFIIGLTLGNRMPFLPVLCNCIGLILMLAVNLFAIAGVMRFFATDDIMAAFKFGEVVAFVQNNIGQLLMAMLVGIGAILAAEILGICPGLGCGFFLTMPYAQLVLWKGFADVYRNSQAAVSM